MTSVTVLPAPEIVDVYPVAPALSVVTDVVTTGGRREMISALSSSELKA